MVNASELIDKLKKQGYSKWKLARLTGVSWQTVHMWDKGTFEPTHNKREVLEKLLVAK